MRERSKAWPDWPGPFRLALGKAIHLNVVALGFTSMMNRQDLPTIREASVGNP